MEINLIKKIEEYPEKSTFEEHGFILKAIDPSKEGSRLSEPAELVLKAFDGTAPEKLWEDDQGNTVWSVAFSPDGQRIATGGNNFKIVVYDSKTGVKLWEDDQGNTVISVAFSPDGQRIATGGNNFKIVVYDSKTGVKLWEDDQGYAVRSVTFSPDGQRIATGGSNNKIIVYDSRTGEKIWEDYQGYAVRSVAFSPDGQRVATGGGNYKIIVYNSITGEKLWEDYQDYTVWSVAFSPDGQSIATGGNNYKIIVYDSRTGEKLWEDDQGDYVRSVAFSPDGQRIATVGNNYKIIVYNSITGEKLWEDYQGNTVRSVAFSPDGQRVATVGNNFKIVVYSLGPVRPIVEEHGFTLKAFGVSKETPRPSETTELSLKAIDPSEEGEPSREGCQFSETTELSLKAGDDDDIPEPKYKAGDKVIAYVPDNWENSAEERHISYVSRMRRREGQTLTIRHNRGYSRFAKTWTYNILEDDYTWCEDWFRPVVPETLDQDIFTLKAEDITVSSEGLCRKLGEDAVIRTIEFVMKKWGRWNKGYKIELDREYSICDRNQYSARFEIYQKDKVVYRGTAYGDVWIQPNSVGATPSLTNMIVSLQKVGNK